MKPDQSDLERGGRVSRPYCLCRRPLLAYHGLPAPHAGWRAGRRAAAAARHAGGGSARPATLVVDSAPAPSVGFDVLACDRCGGRAGPWAR